MSDKTNSIESSEIVELNVGGVFYTTTLATLKKIPECRLGKMFGDDSTAIFVRDAKGKYFIDRDGVLFRYILDYLRNLKLILPENFHERERLRQEADFFELEDLVTSLSALSPKPAHLTPLSSTSSPPGITASALSGSILKPLPSVTGKQPGYITVGYRGTFAFGRDGLADVKFRKLSRIIVCGRISLCREAFKETLNESRDPDRGGMDRYTGRYFLKHTYLEQAFDMLQEEGFFLACGVGTGTNSAGELKAGMDTEEAKWQHYNEFIFERR